MALFSRVGRRARAGERDGGRVDDEMWWWAGESARGETNVGEESEWREYRVAVFVRGRVRVSRSGKVAFSGTRHRREAGDDTRGDVAVGSRRCGVSNREWLRGNLTVCFRRL